MAIWSENQLINGDAAQGLSGWVASNVEVDGGTFKMKENSYMEQEAAPLPKTQAIRVKARYLPQKYDESDTEIHSAIRLELSYADDTHDIAIVPLVGGGL